MAKGAQGFARDASDEMKKAKKEENLAGQEAYNIAQEARKEAMLSIDTGEFEGVDYVNDLTAKLEQLKANGNLDDGTFAALTEDAQVFGDSVDKIIEGAGGGESFSKKFEMENEAMSKINDFKDKIFKVKSFVTDPQFRGILMKGFFIGLGVKAATALADVVKGTVDLVMELGVSFKSLPIAAALAKEETKAMLNEFGSLNDVTSAQLLTMKMRSKLFGVEATDSAKILKLQTSISDVTKDTGLKQQGKFIKEIRKQGLAASKVMADLASNADMFANFAKDGGKNMEDAAAQAAQMGLNLSATNSVAEKLLDYESSIQAEQEASQIIGRQINLDKARQLAVSGNLAQMMEEVKMQAGGEEEFSKMSVIQRQALGDAIGLQGEQLAQLLSDQQSTTVEQEKGLSAVMKTAIAGAILGAVLGAAGIGFGAALIGTLTFGLGAMAAIRGGLSGLAKGSAAGALKGGLAGGALGGAGAKLMGRERGGPVRAGSPYVVGEKRPELFIPSQNGNILSSVPHMAEGTGFVQGDMSETNKLIKDLLVQNERLSKDSIRSNRSAFANK